MDEVFANTPGVETWVTISGFSMMEGAALPNAVTAFVIFESWAKRGTKLNQYAIMDELYRGFGQIPEGEFMVDVYKRQALRLVISCASSCGMSASVFFCMATA